MAPPPKIRAATSGLCYYVVRSTSSMPKKARRKKGGGDTGDEGVVDVGDVDVVSSSDLSASKNSYDMGIRAFVRIVSTRRFLRGLDLACVSEVPTNFVPISYWREVSTPTRSGRKVGTTCGRS